MCVGGCHSLFSPCRSLCFGLIPSFAPTSVFLLFLSLTRPPPLSLSFFSPYLLVLFRFFFLQHYVFIFLLLSLLLILYFYLFHFSLSISHSNYVLSTLSLSFSLTRSFPPALRYVLVVFTLFPYPCLFSFLSLSRLFSTSPLSLFSLYPSSFCFSFPLYLFLFSPTLYLSPLFLFLCLKINPSFYATLYVISFSPSLLFCLFRFPLSFLFSPNLPLKQPNTRIVTKQK